MWIGKPVYIARNEVFVVSIFFDLIEIIRGQWLKTSNDLCGIVSELQGIPLGGPGHVNITCICSSLDIFQVVLWGFISQISTIMVIFMSIILYYWMFVDYANFCRNLPSVLTYLYVSDDFLAEGAGAFRQKWSPNRFIYPDSCCIWTVRCVPGSPANVICGKYPRTSCPITGLYIVARD